MSDQNLEQLQPSQPFIPAFEGVNGDVIGAEPASLADETMGPQGDHKRFKDNPGAYLAEKRREAFVVFEEFRQSEGVLKTDLADHEGIVLPFDKPFTPAKDGLVTQCLVRAGHVMVFEISRIPNPGGPDIVMVRDNTTISNAEGMSNFGYEIVQFGTQRTFGRNEETLQRFPQLPPTLSKDHWLLDYSTEGQVIVQSLEPTTHATEVLSKA